MSKNRTVEFEIKLDGKRVATLKNDNLPNVSSVSDEALAGWLALGADQATNFAIRNLKAKADKEK